MIKNDAEIEAEMQEHINATWPPTRREKAMRLGGALLADLNAFFVTVATLKTQKVAERDLEAAVAAYDQAVARLVRDSVIDAADEVLHAAYLIDRDERAAAQAVIDAAGADVLAVINSRPMV